LQSKAEAHALKFRSSVDLDGDEVHADVHDSFSQMAGGLYPIFHLWRRYYRILGAAPIESETSTVTTINETIDGSVFERWQQNPDYRPPNLERWANQHRVDPNALSASVRTTPAWRCRPLSRDPVEISDLRDEIKSEMGQGERSGAAVGHKRRRVSLAPLRRTAERAPCEDLASLTWGEAHIVRCRRGSTVQSPTLLCPWGKSSYRQGLKGRRGVC
jgi:hypothetical protein